MKAVLLAVMQSLKEVIQCFPPGKSADLSTRYKKQNCMLMLFRCSVSMESSLIHEQSNFIHEVEKNKTKFSLV